MTAPVTVQISDDNLVRTILMHRPERLNAFDGGLVNDLADALTDAAAAPGVAVVVLSGSGRAFSTGADLKALALPREPAAGGDGGNGFDRLLDALADFPKPLLMAVNGYAVGFGMTMLAFADLVFMSTEARLRCPFTELGAPNGGRFELSVSAAARPARGVMDLAVLGVDRCGRSQGHRVGMETLRAERAA